MLEQLVPRGELRRTSPIMVGLGSSGSLAVVARSLGLCSGFIALVVGDDYPSKMGTP